MLDMQTIDIWQQLTVVIDAAIAAVLGSIIGWERDRAGKSAGPRTMALVGSSSAAIVAVGAVLGVDASFGDPTRALHAVITGIGFLGAGLIFTNRRGNYSSNCLCNCRHGGSRWPRFSSSRFRSDLNYPGDFAFHPSLGSRTSPPRVKVSIA
jgi:hypothetical protein